MEKAEEKNVKIHLPVDFIIADKKAEDAQVSDQNKKKYLQQTCHPFKNKIY